MASPQHREAGFVATFLARYLEDQERGKLRSLAEYQAIFPGHEEDVAREMAELATEGARVDSKPVSKNDQRRLGPYELVRALGQGGQGTVWLARDTRLGRQVALKLLKRVVGASEEEIERFRREAAIASHLDDPGICTVYEAGVEDGHPYIAMRLVEGESLAEWIGRIRAEQTHRSSSRERANDAGPNGGPSTEKNATRETRLLDRSRPLEIVRLFEQAARSLHAAHEAGVIHRDIKPSNIMITAQNHAVIMDFGVAHWRQGDLPPLTRTGDLVGTLAYMSPEQLTLDALALDRRTDVWSLGVTLYECLTLRLPFEPPTQERLYHEILTKEPPSPRVFNRAISVDLKVVLETALAKDRARRYESASALAQDLVAVAEGRPIAARSISVAGRAMRWARREPSRAILVGCLLLAFFAAAGLGGYLLAKLPEIRDARLMIESEEVEQLIDSGLVSLLVGNRLEARALFERVLERRPHHPDAIAGLVAAHLRMLFPDETIEPAQGLAAAEQAFLEYAGQGTAEDPEIEWVRAFLLRQRGKEREAESLEDELTKSVPKTAMRHFLDALPPLILGIYGDREAANRSLESLLHGVLQTARPRLAHYWMLGMAANGARRFETARVAASKILQLWPNSAHAFLAAGLSLAAPYDQEGIGYLEGAVRLDPQLRYAWTMLAQQKAMIAGWNDQACQAALLDAQKAVLLKPTFAFGLGLLAPLFRLAGDPDQAVVSARAAVMIDPREATYHFELGMALEQVADRDGSGDYEASLRAYEEAAQLGLHWQSVHAHIARILAKLGKFDESEEHIAIFHRYEPQSSEIYFAIAPAFARAGRMEKALSFLETALRDFPDDSRSWSGAAWFLVGPTSPASWRNPEKGLKYAEHANALAGGRSPATLNTLGVARYRNADYHGAILALEQSDRLRQDAGQTRSPCDHAFIALSMLALERTEEAQAALEIARKLPRFLGEGRDDESALEEAEVSFIAFQEKKTVR